MSHCLVAAGRKGNPHRKDSPEQAAERQEHANAVQRLPRQDFRSARDWIGDRVRDQERQVGTGEPAGPHGGRRTRQHQPPDGKGSGALCRADSRGQSRPNSQATDEGR